MNRADDQDEDDRGDTQPLELTRSRRNRRNTIIEFLFLAWPGLVSLVLGFVWVNLAPPGSWFQAWWYRPLFTLGWVAIILMLAIDLWSFSRLERRMATWRPWYFIMACWATVVVGCLFGQSHVVRFMP